MSQPTVRILLIEDDPVDAGLFQSQLASDFTTRFEIERARDLADGIERLPTSNVDVVVADLLLPDSKGLETVDRLREEAEHLPIVVLTGLDDAQIALQALVRGAQDYLVKGDLSGRLISRSLRYAIERQRLTETLRGLSLLDDVTGLFNPRGFRVVAERQLEVAHRLGRGAAVIVIDAERTRGGECLDPGALRRYLADLVRSTFRASDLLARFGGHRFVVLTLEASRRGAEAAVERLERAHELDRRTRPEASRVELSTRLSWSEPGSLDRLSRSIDEAERGVTETPSPANPLAPP